MKGPKYVDTNILKYKEIEKCVYNFRDYNKH